jgi:hypothetical protein
MGKGKACAVGVVIAGNQSGNDAILEPYRIGADFMLHRGMFRRAIGHVGQAAARKLRGVQPAKLRKRHVSLKQVLRKFRVAHSGYINDAWSPRIPYNNSRRRTWPQ